VSTTCQDADHGQDAGIDVGDRVAGLDRRSARLAGHRHQPGKALRDQVEAALVGVRAVAAVARDRAVDQARVHLAQDVVAEPQLFQRAAPVVLGQDVGILHHAQQDRPALRGLEVQRDPALVAVQDHERRGDAVHPRFAVAARIVAARQLLDLDDVGAHVGQHHAAGRAGHDLGQLQHAQAGQRTRMGCCGAPGCRFHHRSFVCSIGPAQVPVQAGRFFSRKASTPMPKSRLP
jgi:hypothetical protein